MFFITLSCIVFTSYFFSFIFLSSLELFLSLLGSLWIHISSTGFLLLLTFILPSCSCSSSLISVIFCLCILLFIIDRNSFWNSIRAFYYLSDLSLFFFFIAGFFFCTMAGFGYYLMLLRPLTIFAFDGVVGFLV